MLFLNMVIFTMYFGGGIVPFYLQVKNLGLIDSLLAMVVPAGINTFYMIVVRNYFQALPPELDESARIDGANDIQILFKIVLPLSLPVLATFTLFYGVDRWNEWYNGMLFIKTPSKLPLQYVLRSIISNVNSMDRTNIPTEMLHSSFSDGIKMASVVVVMMPIMLLYPFVQKYFMKGIMVGALKG